jgi:hypothetical protein
VAAYAPPPTADVGDELFFFARALPASACALVRLKCADAAAELKAEAFGGAERGKRGRGEPGRSKPGKGEEEARGLDTGTREVMAISGPPKDITRTLSC